MTQISIPNRSDKGEVMTQCIIVTILSELVQICRIPSRQRKALRPDDLQGGHSLELVSLANSAKKISWHSAISRDLISRFFVAASGKRGVQVEGVHLKLAKFTPK